MKSSARIVVFVKYPVPGSVKTRLAKSLGSEKAADLYRKWVPRFMEGLMPLGHEVSIEVALSPQEPNGAGSDPVLLQNAREWLDYPVQWSFQSGKDLGERLTKTFERCFRLGFEKVLVLGSDSPHLGEQTVRILLHLLEEHPIVVGPTTDGGYYGIGLRQPPRDLFHKVRWSTRQTLDDTVAAAESLGWSVGLGPESFDIDTISDFNRLIETCNPCWSDLLETAES